MQACNEYSPVMKYITRVTVTWAETCACLYLHVSRIAILCTWAPGLRYPEPPKEFCFEYWQNTTDISICWNGLGPTPDSVSFNLWGTAREPEDFKNPIRCVSQTLKFDPGGFALFWRYAWLVLLLPHFLFSSSLVWHCHFDRL